MSPVSRLGLTKSVVALTLLLSSTVKAQEMTAAAADATAKPPGLFSGGKLLATGGVSQLEGAGGGGLTPWALITGNATEEGIGANAHYTAVYAQEYNLQTYGVAIGLFDRLELSYARQGLRHAGDRSSSGPGAGDTRLVRTSGGLKLRVLGDAVYDQDIWLPQVALGAQWKHADHAAILAAVGARDDEGVDFYASATKVLLAESLLVNATLRFTRANQTGLLGFGGDREDDYEPALEGSVAWMIRRDLVAGVEYRMKPDNLGFAKEDDWADVFVAWFPSPHVSVTLAYADLGDIATREDQRAFYLSLQSGF
jgi:hypothetical protein